MAQTKFDKQVEESAESLVFGIGRFLAGRPMDGERKTDATFWRTGTRVLPKVEGKVSRSSYRAGWQCLVFRLSWLGAAGGGAYLVGSHPDTTAQTVRDVWANPDPPSPPRRPVASAWSPPQPWAAPCTGWRRASAGSSCASG
ncbi:hypothetical protein [Streptomyces nogalater]|uniref:Uncharacterized protein n=1 Tax=Streptomyces nogalater TaxID=38314 RepID=A0ABW0WND5_STRNO